MPTDVLDALKAILAAHGGATPSEADAFLAGLERTKRLVVEAWS
jgi:sulfite reductase alpha subunit-like flavoprotein